MIELLNVLADLASIGSFLLALYAISKTGKK